MPQGHEGCSRGGLATTTSLKMNYSFGSHTVLFEMECQGRWYA